jgi:DNA-binding transcriptional LysR family regulator
VAWGKILGIDRFFKLHLAIQRITFGDGTGASAVVPCTGRTIAFQQNGQTFECESARSDKENPTDVGKLLQEQADQVVRMSDQLLIDMQRAARGEIGKLGIGFGFHTFELVPRIVAQLRKRVPEVRIKLRDMSTGEQLAALGSGAIDIGFVRLPVSREFEQLPVIQDSLAIVCSPEWKSDGHRHLADCREEAFVMLSSERSPTLRQHALRLCAKYGFSPRIVQEAHELPTLFALARAGVGVAMVPFSACKAGINGVRVDRIPDKEANWTVGAAWRKGEKAVLLTSFLELLKKELSRFREEGMGRSLRRPG